VNASRRNKKRLALFVCDLQPIFLSFFSVAYGILRRLQAQKAKEVEEARLREEEKKRREEEAEKKREEQGKERAAYVATAQMSMQAKIQAFQAASAALTADLQSGKITAAEYGAQMAGLSNMLK